ncbi:MAG TPA: Na+/H+ antiporter NhaA [Thermomicrobiales bacterium]|nr:Na+/H+ antiporter NhaA [Thermomicrobiales bacterium]
MADEDRNLPADDVSSRVPASQDTAVTSSIVWDVMPDRAKEFEDLLQGMTYAAAGFPGFAGVRVLRPIGGDTHFRVVVRFNRASNLAAWRESEIYAEYTERLARVVQSVPRAADITGTQLDRRLALAILPISGFVRTTVSGIGLLLLGAGLALIFANTPLSDTYERFWETSATIGIGRFGITESLRHWVNDGLMALFFFIVGLEIKREVLVGELRTVEQAALPIAAAIGGGLIPALVYSVINLGGGGAHGWGIPMGTDTAFSLGIISLFGTAVPVRLWVFLTAFAIVDDILAVLVIAVFYTDAIEWFALVVAVALVAALAFANLAGFHRWPVYAVLGLGVWLAVFESGIHGTLAGVLVAMTIPARSWINASEFLRRGREAIDDFESSCEPGVSILSNETQQRAVQELEELSEAVETPMSHFQHQLNPWVSYAVLPLFAFANAGIVLVDGLGDALSSRVTWGIVAALIVGKPIGISLFSWLSVRVGMAALPASVTWRQIAGVACLGGIGFTMSLFISELAFGASELAHDSRVGILIGSVIAGVVGYVVLRHVLAEPAADSEPG